MSFDWKEYYDLAKYLYKNKKCIENIDEESILRNVVSRAYYSSFCYARNYAIEKFSFISTKDGSDHGKLPRFYRNNGMIDVSVKIEKMRNYRNLCDYENEITNLDNLAKNSLDYTEKIFKQLY